MIQPWLQHELEAQIGAAISSQSVAPTIRTRSATQNAAFEGERAHTLLRSMLSLAGIPLGIAGTWHRKQPTPPALAPRTQASEWNLEVLWRKWARNQADGPTLRLGAQRGGVGEGFSGLGKM